MAGQTGQQGYGAPMAAMMAMSGRVPMFSADTGPRYTGPFNAGGQYGPLLEVAAPAVMQMLMGSQNMPAQFWPEQQLYDQMEATRHFEAGQQAMAIAARRDIRAMEKMLGGVTQLMTKRPLTQMQTARNARIASGVADYMPMLTQVFGPDLVDQLHGSRGSATVFAQQFHQAMRTAIDPIDHRAGYSGQSAGRVTQEVFERLFGEGADPGRMRGMSAGQAGILLNELQARGMLGKPMGLLPVDEQRSLLPRTLTPDVVNRLAEQLPAVQDILKNGGTPNEDVLAAARQQIQASHGKLIDPTVKMTQQDLESLPGGEEIVRAGDAERITQKLANLSGAVKAMRDIFGDMGNPNAPMREIMNGLEALTQGGLATMSAGQVEMMVRKTHTIAKQTGIGVEGMIALTSQNAELADRLGLDRSFAVTAAQQAAAFGAAAGDRLRLDIPAWGALTKEQLTLSDQQLRMHAASSPLANQMNALMRMSDTGMIRPGEETELAAMTAAIRRGDTQYDFQGRKRDIATPHAELIRMLRRDAGLGETQAYAVLQDIKGNQEFGQIYNTVDTIRRIQPAETVRRLLMPALGGRLHGMLTDEGIDKRLQERGIVANETEFRQMMTRVSQGVSEDFLAMDAETARTEPRARDAMGESVRNRLIAEIKAKMPNATPAEIDAMLGDRGMGTMGASTLATINQVAATHPLFKSRHGLHSMLSRDALAQAASRERQAEMAVMTQSALAGLGTAGPVQRLSDVLQNATHETSLQDILGTALGGVNVDAIRAADPNGGLAQVFDLVQANKKLDPTDPKQFAQARRNAAIMRGLVEGGDSAAAQMRLLDASRDADGKLTIGNSRLYQQLEAAAKRGSDTSLLGELGYQLGANVSIDQVRAIVDSGAMAEKLLTNKTASNEERASAVATFVAGARERGRQLLGDERSMQIIGQGGLELVNSAMQQSDKLQAMAAEQSKKLGKPITESDLLRGANGVPADVAATARQIFGRLQLQWGEIDKRRGFGLLPGQGDPANAARQAMTPQELEDLKAQQQFISENPTADTRAAAVLDRMMAIATPDQRARLGVDVNRKQLLAAIVEGDRGLSLDRALHSRQELLEMGLAKGVFKGKTKLSELTDEDELAAAAKLSEAGLTAAERKDFERLQRAASPLMDFGMQGLGADEITQDALRRVRQAPTSQAPPVDGRDKEMKVTVTGNVTQRSDGTADLALEGRGLMDQVDNMLGMV